MMMARPTFSLHFSSDCCKIHFSSLYVKHNFVHILLISLFSLALSFSFSLRNSLNPHTTRYLVSFQFIFCSCFIQFLMVLFFSLSVYRCRWCYCCWCVECSLFVRNIHSHSNQKSEIDARAREWRQCKTETEYMTPTQWIKRDANMFLVVMLQYAWVIKMLCALRRCLQSHTCTGVDLTPAAAHHPFDDICNQLAAPFRHLHAFNRDPHIRKHWIARVCAARERRERNTTRKRGHNSFVHLFACVYEWKRRKQIRFTLANKC